MISDSQALSLSASSILWRTAGLDWDYDFILVPTTVKQESWYWFHRSAFKSINPSHIPQGVLGVLSCYKKSHPFIATVFLDSKYTDRNGRPIAHFLVWFHNGYSREVLSRLLPSDWGQQIVTVLGRQFDEVFSADKAPRTSDFLKLVRDETINLLPADGVNGIGYCEDIGTLKKNVETEAPSPERKRVNPLLTIIKIAAACLVILVFLLSVRNCSETEHTIPISDEQQSQ